MTAHMRAPSRFLLVVGVSILLVRPLELLAGDAPASRCTIVTDARDLQRACLSEPVPDPTFRWPANIPNDYTGTLQWIYPDGTLWFELGFRCGRRQGKEMVWHQNGKPWREREYEYGFLLQKVIAYHENGCVATKIEVNRETATGTGMWWNEKGELLASGTYRFREPWNGTFRRYLRMTSRGEKEGTSGAWHTLTFKEGVLIRCVSDPD